jgi:3-phosphoshikimate 1-carboxyvinyltransferase
MSSLELTPRSFAPGPLLGTIRVPGDKSVSHRALILGAAAPKPLEIHNLNPGRDVRATMEALIALGARVDSTGGVLRLHATQLREPMGALDCMNSGSTARMMLGVCAGADVPATFDGDDSLRRRPMEPVAAQLRAFGAKIETTDGKLPLRIEGTPQRETHRFILVSPSAQVKSALLLAALFAKTSIAIVADRNSRDHTERMLRYLGADITWDGSTIELRSPITNANPITVCGDFSSAAFFIVAATVAPGSELTIEGVGVNPTRTGLLDALLNMGAKIELRNPRDFRANRSPISTCGTRSCKAPRSVPTGAARDRRSPRARRRSGLRARRDEDHRRARSPHQRIRPRRSDRAAAFRGRRWGRNGRQRPRDFGRSAARGGCAYRHPRRSPHRDGGCDARGRCRTPANR